MSKIYVPPTPDFENHPADESPYQMVCCDVIDSGWLPREFQGEYKGHAPHCRLVFQSLIRAQNGERMTMRTFDTAMLWSEKAKWYAIIKAWLGQQALNKIIASGDFDAESVIGINALVAVELRPSKKDPTQSYANIESISKWPTNFGAPINIDPQYIRMCDRPEWRDKRPQHSSFEDWSQHFAPEPQQATQQPSTLRQPAPQARQPVLSALQMIIAAAQRANPADVLVPEQVFTILYSQGYDKRIIAAEDQNVCEEIVLNYLKHNEPPIVTPPTRAPAAMIDQPAPGQISNRHDTGEAARRMAAGDFSEPATRRAKATPIEALPDDFSDADPFSDD